MLPQIPLLLYKYDYKRDLAQDTVHVHACAIAVPLRDQALWAASQSRHLSPPSVETDVRISSLIRGTKVYSRDPSILQRCPTDHHHKHAVFTDGSCQMDGGAGRIIRAGIICMCFLSCI